MLNSPKSMSEPDSDTLSMKKLTDAFQRAKARQEVLGKPLKAVRLSQATLLMIPVVVPTSSTFSAISTFYGVPVEIDNSLALWEFKEVYA